MYPSLTHSDIILCCLILSRILRHIRPRSLPNQRRRTPIHSVGRTSRRPTCLGSMPRQRRPNQHVDPLLHHRWRIMPRHLATSQIIRYPHLLCDSPRRHSRNSLERRRTAYGSDGRRARSWFGIEHFLADFDHPCACGAAFGDFVVELLGESSGEDRGEFVL
jgi:hypothetical protein